MKTYVLGALIGFSVATTVGGANNVSGPVVINLDAPGDAILLTLDGKPAGGLRVDDQGRIGIFGPNRASTIVTIDAYDRVQIDPHPVESPAPRLTIDQDVWLTGVLRVGRADAFGDAPFDPNGAIQVGRNLPTAQPMALFRAFAQGKESFRLGTDANGNGYWSDGPHDSPLMTFHPSAEGKPNSGSVRVYSSEVRPQ